VFIDYDQRRPTEGGVAVDLGSNLVQPGSDRRICWAYAALTPTELAAYAEYVR